MTGAHRPVVVLAALAEEAIAIRPRDGLQVVVSGVGKVAAAMAAQQACDRLTPAALLSIGVAGGVESATARGRVVVASGAVQHDYDARPYAPARGVIPGPGISMFPADEALRDRLVNAARRAVEDDSLVRTGLVLTGDQIIASSDLRDAILRDFPDGACFDMETAAVAQVAHANGVPWGGVRITSDSADESFDLDEVLGFGAATASELFDRLLGNLLGEIGRQGEHNHLGRAPLEPA